MIEIVINRSQLNNVDRLLVNMGRKAKKPTVALKEIGLEMLLSINKNFEAEGRPNRWAPLSAMTLAMRRNKNKASSKILQDTGILRGSINYQLTDDEQGVAIGTNIKYAAPHQYGARINMSARTIIPKKAKVLRFVVDGKVVYSKYAKQKARTITIPARPYLLFQDEDISSIQQILLESLVNEESA